MRLVLEGWFFSQSVPGFRNLAARRLSAAFLTPANLRALVTGAVLGVRGLIVAEPVLGTATLADRRAALGVGDVGRYAGPFARDNVLARIMALVVAAIEPLDAVKVFRHADGFGQQTQIAASIAVALMRAAAIRGGR